MAASRTTASVALPQGLPVWAVASRRDTGTQRLTDAPEIMSSVLGMRQRASPAISASSTSRPPGRTLLASARAPAFRGSLCRRLREADEPPDHRRDALERRPIAHTR